MTCLLCPRNSGKGLPEKLGGGVRHASWNPYPISDQNLWFSLPYDTYTVVGVNIKTEMFLLPNDEEVANSSKKTYAIQD